MGFKRPRVRISTLGPITPREQMLFRCYFFDYQNELEASCITITWPKAVARSAYCFEFESRHSDQKSRRNISFFCFFISQADNELEVSCITITRPKAVAHSAYCFEFESRHSRHQSSVALEQCLWARFAISGK